MTRLLALLAIALVACAGTRIAPERVTLLGVFDLPRSGDTEALSGLSFDEPSRTLWALQDTVPRLVPLRASADYAVFTVGTPLSLTGRPGLAWDGEALARSPDGGWLVVANERTPVVERYTANGAYLGSIALPSRFARQQPESFGIESLSISPSGHSLFYANEAALGSDGPLASVSGGTIVRLHRHSLETGVDDERAYRTDGLGEHGPGVLGVPDVAALSDDALLVLERSYQAGYGNAVRLYEATFSSGPDVAAIAALPPTSTVVQKRLVVDLATLPARGTKQPSLQPNPLLDNYEGVALGPVLPDGRRVVFVISDDNQRRTQVARILTLALPRRR